jgi:hypothetical protein
MHANGQSYLLSGKFFLLETYYIINSWVQNHLLREAWPDPLEMPPGVAAKVH